MRISDGSNYFECVQEVANKLNVRGNEVNGIDEVQKVVRVIHDGEVCNKDSAKSKGGKKVEEGIEHRVANPKSKRAERGKQKRRVKSF